MYPWNSAPAAPAPSVPKARKAPQAPKAATIPPATSAVQVALDRRDNGGDAAAEPTAALARQ
jgi:hypothetical protein